jgi:sulfur carrier protein
MLETNASLPHLSGEGGVGARGVGASPIQILLDAHPHSLPAQTTLATLVASLGHAPDKVTTAVNGMFVRRDQRDGCVLQAGDAVLLFQPITGG